MNQETAQKRKKVLFLITKGTWGGAQRYVFDLATHLPKESFEPVVAYGVPGRLSEKLRENSIGSEHLPSLGRDIALISDVRSFFEIVGVLRKHRPDVLHLNSSKAAALGALAARVVGVRNIIFTVHGWPFGESRSLLAKVLMWKVSWLTALLAHKVICVSEYDLRLAKRMPFVGHKAVRIYNGIAPMAFGTGDVVRRFFTGGAHITGTVGELNKNKNQIALIEQARIDPGVYVAIVGDGEDRAYLAKKIGEYGLDARVKLLGFMPATDVLKGFDTFALPSIKEGLPYVLLEAKQAGLPIVANRVGGVSEILDAKDMSEFTLPKMVDKTVALY